MESNSQENTGEGSSSSFIAEPDVSPFIMLPAELLLSIRDFLPSEADRQCLRITCRRFYYSFSAPPWAKRKAGDTYPRFTFNESDESLQFLCRLLRDFPEEKKANKGVCLSCRRIRPIRPFGYERDAPPRTTPNLVRLRLSQSSFMSLLRKGRVWSALKGTVEEKKEIRISWPVRVERPMSCTICIRGRIYDDRPKKRHASLYEID